MKKKVDIAIKIVSVSLALVFLFQAFSSSVLIPVQPVLKYFGVGENILDVMFVVFYVALLVVGAGILLSFLNRLHIIKGLTKNTLLLRMLVRAFMLFIIFFPTFLSYFIFGGMGFLGKDIQLGISNKVALFNLNQMPFVNLYLFWYLLITAFIKPEIVPEFGIKKEEESGLV